MNYLKKIQLLKFMLLYSGYGGFIMLLYTKANLSYSINHTKSKLTL